MIPSLLKSKQKTIKMEEECYTTLKYEQRFLGTLRKRQVMLTWELEIISPER